MISDANDYKESGYNIFGRVDGMWLLANTFTSALLRLDDEGKAAAEYLLKHPENIAEFMDAPLVEALVENGFLIPEDYSEMESLKRTHGVAMEGEGSLGLAITTTMQCNFRCSYCYEYDRLGPTHLPEHLQKSILALLRRELQKKQVLHVVWWGGEPLLRPQTIESLSAEMMKCCKEFGVKYLASITTNGSLLNTKNAAMLHANLVKRVQITLDGGKESHDQRRVTVSGGATFDEILKNIRENGNLFENIILRINIDRRNCDQAFKLLEELEPVKKNVHLALRPANDPHATERPDWMLSLKEFMSLEEEFNNRAYRSGYRIVVGYTEAGMTYCNAYQSKNSYSVDPFGGVHICPVFTGDESNKFGTLTADGRILKVPKIQNLESRLATTEYPFSDPDCMSCKALPVCMGGCALYDAKKVPPGMGDLRCIAKHNTAEKMYLNCTWDFSTEKAEPIC